MEAPVWRVLTSTNVPALRTGVAHTASTKPRQVSTTRLISKCSSGLSQMKRPKLLFLIQHHLSGASWMIQHSAGGLAVPKWTVPNTAAVMQAFTWVAPLTTVSARVSCNYVLLNWFLWGNSPFAPHSEDEVSYRAVPSSRCLARQHLIRTGNSCYQGFLADV